MRNPFSHRGIAFRFAEQVVPIFRELSGSFASLACDDDRMVYRRNERGQAGNAGERIHLENNSRAEQKDLGYRTADLKQVRAQPDNSYNEVRAIVKKHSDDEVFEKKKYRRTGATSLEGVIMGIGTY